MSAAGSVTLAGRVAGRIVLDDRVEEHVRHHRPRVVTVRRFEPAIEPALALAGVELGREARQVGSLVRRDARELAVRMARQAAARFEQPLAALGRRRFRNVLRRIDVLERLAIGEQELGERANLDLLEPLGVLAVGDLLLVAGRVADREILVFASSRCSKWPKNCGIRVVGRKSAGRRIQLYSQSKSTFESRWRRLGPTLRKLPGVSTSFSASASACVAGVRRGCFGSDPALSSVGRSVEPGAVGPLRECGVSLNRPGKLVRESMRCLAARRAPEPSRARRRSGPGRSESARRLRESSARSADRDRCASSVRRSR